MKPLLLYQDHDAHTDHQLKWNATDLITDLQLPVFFETMAMGDDFVLDACKKVMLNNRQADLDTILYRQKVMEDCLNNKTLISQLFNLSKEGMEIRKKNFFGVISNYPSAILSGSRSMMRIYVDLLRRLCQFANINASSFQSAGFERFFNMLKSEFTEDYLQSVISTLQDLQLQYGLLINARLGSGIKGTRYILHRYRQKPLPWYLRLFHKKSGFYSFNIHPRDDGGIRVISGIKDSVLDNVANVLAQSCDHIFAFFTTLHFEIAFYIGCINLENKLSGIGMEISYPVAVKEKSFRCSFKSLYDISLSLSMNRRVVTNNLEANGKNPVIITGANQGGKTTFLRSVGIAQLMGEAGMFVGAGSSVITVSDQLITHFKREEDISMKSGKFDEELNRMNIITDKITSNSILLFNESFASTNEREGSEIAIQIVKALIENNTRVFFVTHLYEFAHNIYIDLKGKVLLIRAERQEGGLRTFKLLEEEPRETSYGLDLYNKIFENKS